MKGKYNNVDICNNDDVEIEGTYLNKAKHIDKQLNLARSSTLATHEDGVHFKHLN